MKNLMLGTAMAVALVSTASAQEMFRTEMNQSAIAASEFIGMRVYASETATDPAYAGLQDGWDDIGEINDVILTREGEVDSVLVDIGGFLGIGERQVALAMESIRFVSDSATADNADDFFLVVNANRPALEGAPEYMRMGSMPAAPNDAAATSEAATTTADAKTPMAPAEGMIQRDGYAAYDMATLTSEKIMGARVYGANDEELGEVSNLVLDPNGKVQEVIVDVGGFLGLGERPVAIEMGSVQILQAAAGGDLRVYVPMTEEQLEALPMATN